MADVAVANTVRWRLSTTKPAKSNREQVVSSEGSIHCANTMSANTPTTNATSANTPPTMSTVASFTSNEQSELRMRKATPRLMMA